MKKNVYLIAGLVLMFLISSNIAVSAADTKIGFINMQQVMQNSVAGKKATEDFKKLVDKKKDAIAAMENELKKMKDELDKQRTVLKESAFREKDNAFQKKYRDYQLLVKDTEKELKDRDQEVSNLIIPEILKAVRAVGEREKYTVIMDIASMPVPYFTPSNDISKKVIEEYNKAHAAKK